VPVSIPGFDILETDAAYGLRLRIRLEFRTIETIVSAMRRRFGIALGFAAGLLSTSSVQPSARRHPAERVVLAE
jgi:hypothetical protein